MLITAARQHQQLVQQQLQLLQVIIMVVMMMNSVVGANIPYWDRPGPIRVCTSEYTPVVTCEYR